MKKWLLTSLMLVLAALIVIPSSALAYSYGDANTEDVAETFKLVQTSLGDGANDWNAAQEAYKVRRAEIAAHFGEEVAVTLDTNFQAKDNKAVVSNFKAVLVMNLERRFTYASKGLDDYAQAKLLLAKAKATFDTLQPYIGSGSDDINKAFDVALDALGNPGLFGVGKKEVQPEVFKEKVNFIYNKVKPLFPYKAAVKTAAPSEPAPTAKPQETPKAEAAVSSKPEQQTPASKGQEAKPAESKQPDAAVTATGTLAPESSASAAASSTPAPTTDTAQATPAAEASAKPAETPAGSEAAKAEPAKEAAAHAPMQRTDKTNPLVSIAVIGAVIVVLGGGVWFARKKKWI
ncbi:hypothetical protein [Paenibacillus sedimenti]|uniref:LPXTG cell wall anchor domain-containing protein n=1 Tax=Paenibacillus sedimenti TaxID=2770274 RepID=A0A926KUC7_9BACL|nr:hypothetical protein [Paenibacillus sedimenti]MBD0382145.1 hypothetical protein [Paenibacillus sedimenti]